MTIPGTGEVEAREWPRSNGSDALVALQSAARATDAWRRLDRRSRIERLEHAADVLAREPDPDHCIASALGLEPAELDSRRAHLADVVRRALDAPIESQRETPSGLAILAPHWTELVSGPACDVLRALADGACVIAVSDPHLPQATHALASALERAELPAGVFALLHDDGETTLAALLASATDAELRACGTRERVRRMRTLADRGGASLRTRLVELRNATYVVRAHDDLQASARHVLDVAIGRAHALSGQAPSQIGRVVCHERSFSRFTAELLAAFDASTDAPIAIREWATILHGTRARDLGLDEGATLLRTGPPRIEASRTGSSRIGSGSGALPIVFTNVEEHMRLAALSRPAPVLCLMRATSDAAADELRERLDSNPAAEDLASA